jgi:hypothetical protein
VFFLRWLVPAPRHSSISATSKLKSKRPLPNGGGFTLIWKTMEKIKRFLKEFLAPFLHMPAWWYIAVCVCLFCAFFLVALIAGHKPRVTVTSTSATYSDTVDETMTGSPLDKISSETAGRTLGIYTDPTTQCQYYMTNSGRDNSSITPRLGRDGKPMCEASTSVYP